MTRVRARATAGPSRRSLRELPELAFERYSIRPNRFAMRVKDEGIELLHDGPSAASLAAMPEPDLATARPRSSSARPRRGKGGG